MALQFTYVALARLQLDQLVQSIAAGSWAAPAGGGLEQAPSARFSADDAAAGLHDWEHSGEISSGAFSNLQCSVLLHDTHTWALEVRDTGEEHHHPAGPRFSVAITLRALGSDHQIPWLPLLPATLQRTARATAKRRKSWTRARGIALSVGSAAHRAGVLCLVAAAAAAVSGGAIAAATWRQVEAAAAWAALGADDEQMCLLSCTMVPPTSAT